MTNYLVLPIKFQVHVTNGLWMCSVASVPKIPKCFASNETSIVSSVTIPVVGPGLVSTSPARRRRRRTPMMLLLDHTFMRRFACTQRGFLLYETALLFTQVCFTASCRWQRTLVSILDCVSQWHNKVYLASLTKCSLQNQNFSKYLVTTVGDSILIALR